MTDMRIGSGLDVHPFAGGEDRPLVLAGVTVPDAAGLDGHSDADVVAHAVADALLGAIGAGDLGARFGVDEPAVADADSLRLLAEVVDQVRGAGWRIENVDLTVIAQRPRLAPHRKAMAANLARVLDTSAVSVKFTTTDRIGAIGRGEGIACWAVALLAAR